MPEDSRKRGRESDASRLVELRERHGLTQQDCADALGIGQPSYAKMESGQTPLRRRDRVTLAVRYGLGLSVAFPTAESREDPCRAAPPFAATHSCTHDTPCAFMHT